MCRSNLWRPITHRFLLRFIPRDVCYWMNLGPRSCLSAAEDDKEDGSEPVYCGGDTKDYAPVSDGALKTCSHSFEILEFTAASRPYFLLDDHSGY